MLLSVIALNCVIVLIILRISDAVVRRSAVAIVGLTVLVALLQYQFIAAVITILCCILLVIYMSILERSQFGEE